MLSFTDTPSTKTLLQRQTTKHTQLFKVKTKVKPNRKKCVQSHVKITRNRKEFSMHKVRTKNETKKCFETWTTKLRPLCCYMKTNPHKTKEEGDNICTQSSGNRWKQSKTNQKDKLHWCARQQDFKIKQEITGPQRATKIRHTSIDM